MNIRYRDEAIGLSRQWKKINQNRSFLLDSRENRVSVTGLNLDYSKLIQFTVNVKM